MVLANDASQLAVVINKAKPRFLFRSSPNTQLRIYDITSNHDTITISDSVTFSTHNLKSLAYSQNNTYLYYQKQDKQGAVDLYRYSISAKSSEAITAVSAQGKMKYANENIYIMDVEQIEVLSSTDTADIAYLPKSTISPGGSYKMSGFSASTTVAIAGPGSFFYGHQGSLYSRELDFKRYELKDHLGNVRVVISDVKEPTDDDYDQFTADLQSYYNYYPFGMLQPKRHYTLAEEYNFGFNGKEMDNQISQQIDDGYGGLEDNAGTHYDFGARIYSSRLGRFFSLDPDMNKYPYMTPYCYAANSPILLIDINGLGPGDPPGPSNATLNHAAKVTMTTYISLENVGRIPDGQVIVDFEGQTYTSGEIEVIHGNAPNSGRNYEAVRTLIFKEDGSGSYYFYHGQYSQVQQEDKRIPSDKQGNASGYKRYSHGQYNGINTESVKGTLALFLKDINSDAIDFNTEKEMVTSVDVNFVIKEGDNPKSVNRYKSFIENEVKRNFGKNVQINYTTTIGDQANVSYTANTNEIQQDSE
jgi:RHS repeat-associated protein